MSDEANLSDTKSDQEPLANGERSVAHLKDVKNSPTTTGDDNEVISVGDISGNDGPVVIGKNIVIGTSLPTAQYQLPPSTEDFVGRSDYIDQLLQVLGAASKSELATPVICCIRGLGGIGKTALAYEVARKLTTSFPDGQIVLNLRGATGMPIAPVQALRSVIQAFAPQSILPGDLTEFQGLYRSLLHNKRVLILADDALNAAQIRPLIPPTGSALLITSRELFSLGNTFTFDLKTLLPTEAEHLLLGRCSRIGEAAPQLAQLCGYLPLALRISADLLATDEPLRVEHYLKRLKSERLKYLRDPADPENPEASVEASLHLSYDSLNSVEQKVLCQLSVFPFSFDLEAATAVVIDTDSVEDVLILLRRRSLLEWNKTNDRYDLHDLVREYAMKHLGKDINMAQMRRVYYYVQVAHQSREFFRKGDTYLLQGLELFDREQAHIDSCWDWLSRQPEKPEIDEILLRYADATIYIGDLRYDLRRERIPQLEKMMSAARRLDQKAAEAVAWGSLGLIYAAIGDFHRAIDCYEQQIAIAQQLSDHRSEEYALRNRDNAFKSLGKIE